MSKLSFSVRIAAALLVFFSILHVFFWAIIAISAQSLHRDYPNTLLFPIASVFSAAGLGGLFIGAGLLRGRSWARISTLVLAALVAVFCVLGVLALLLILVGNVAAVLGIEIGPDSKSYLTGMGILYFFVLCIAIWWIYLFSRSSVAEQFTAPSAPIVANVPKKPACPPPIALLAWLMIVSSFLSAISWPLILGKIPAMLFTHIFSSTTSKWIWITNIALFLVCGVGLLRLRRWSYSGAIALHTFWLISVFVMQLSSDYDAYMRRCIETLRLGEAYPALSRIHVSPWASAVTTAVPTALLIAGLFYYRRSFVQAVAAKSAAQS